jgi:ABC-type bacteriocin/lantibiotic exporters, contain an N-terminal double-glycine peptidase domain
MKTIIQEDSYGCGIACIAMITGKSYRDIKNRHVDDIRRRYGDNRDSIDISVMRLIISQYGINLPEDRDFDDWEEIVSSDEQKDCLVAINCRGSGYNAEYHWVVYDGEAEFVRDPNNTIKKHERRDFGKMKPYFYMPIEYA